MTAAEPAEADTPRSEPLPHQLLCALAQHRMATTRQLHDLLRPNVARQTVSTPLNKLRRKGLIDYTALPQLRQHARPHPHGGQLPAPGNADPHGHTPPPVLTRPAP
ncbi:hypothetical protein AQJ23_16375 [Streptomyces antibioticus]|nr:hypothetical protein AQJ23_16375 [Streptomyces antibioticus]